MSLAPPLPPEFRHSAWNLVRFYLEGGDMHPPLSVLYFTTLHNWGIGEAALRLGSLLMTAAALALWQLLSLALIAARGGTPPGPMSRLIAVLLFGLCPMAIGLGDAIRWYPQLALCIALWGAMYLGAETRAIRLASAMPLGLAVSINLIAPLVIVPFAIYRYLLVRAWRPSFDLAYWALFGVAASPGLYAAVSIAQLRLPGIWTDKFADNPATAAAADILGVFGGNAVGVGEAWLLLPAIAIAAVAIATQIDWRRPANPIHLPLLLLGAAVPAALAGFSESRSFLYLAPVLAAVVTVFLACGASGGRTLLLACGAIVPGLAAIGELRTGAHPFKREAAIPFDEIIDFIDTNESDDTLVVSTDPVVPWELARRPDPRRCVSHFFDQSCFADLSHYRSVFIVSGHSDRSHSARSMQQFAARLAEITVDRSKVAELGAGHDNDAALKARLTGVPLDAVILTVDLYR